MAPPVWVIVSVLFFAFLWSSFDVWREEHRKSYPVVKFVTEGIVLPPGKRVRGYNDWAVFFRVEIGRKNSLRNVRVAARAFARRDLGSKANYESLSRNDTEVLLTKSGQPWFKPGPIYEGADFALLEGSPDGKTLHVFAEEPPLELAQLYPMKYGEYKLQLVLSADDHQTVSANAFIRWDGKVENTSLRIVPD